MKISKCSEYNIEEAFVIYLDGNECYWKDYNQCIDKTVINAPSTYEQNHECQNYSENCTINPITSLECFDMICENIVNQEICITDLNDNLIIYIDSCSSKECSLAKLTTAQECNNYLSECTLNDEGNECTLLPPTCRRNKQMECGIIELSFDDDDCVWGLGKCQSRSCQTAQIELESINMDQYKYYLECSEDITQCCIVNNESTIIKIDIKLNYNCQEQSTCDILNQSNCVYDVAIEGKCFWNGATCINADNMQCKDYIGEKHYQCNQLIDTCTTYYK